MVTTDAELLPAAVDFVRQVVQRLGLRYGRLMLFGSPSSGPTSGGDVATAFVCTKAISRYTATRASYSNPTTTRGRGTRCK
jgi:hypothetical protein